MVPRVVLHERIPVQQSFGCHKFAGQTLLDGIPVRRRIHIVRRRDLAYVASTFSTPSDGTFVISHLPPQTLSEPYLALCFDDTGGNAQVYDRVYQVDDNGNPPIA
jgi:hypothetical protein